MLEQVLLYYILFIPASLVFFFCPLTVQIIFTLFLVLVTTSLPYSKKFIINSLKKLPSFMLLSLVFIIIFLFIFDLVSFLSIIIGPYSEFLLFIPIYISFKLLTLPWIFVEEGFSAPLTCWNLDSSVNWKIMAVLSTLWLFSIKFPLAPFILMVPISFLIKKFIDSAQKVNKTPVLN